MPKKILIVTEYFYPEEFKINDLALSWRDSGYEIDVLTMVPSYPLSKVYEGYKNRYYQKEIWKGINIHRVKTVEGYKASIFKKFRKYFKFMITGSIVALIIGKKYDYIFGFNIGPLTAMVPAIVIRKIHQKPLTLWAQDLWPNSVYAYGFKKRKIVSFFLEKFVRFVYFNIDNIAISSKGFESLLRAYVKKDLIFNFSPNWADSFDMSLEPYDFGKGKIHFTFAGNIGKMQNLENIIMAFNALGEKYQKKIQFNIIGDGSELEALKKIDSKANIVFYGRKSSNEMNRYYMASDFLVVSLIDKKIFSITVPAKTQTYIAARKPILAILNGETAEIVRDNNLGFTADPGSIDSIKDVLVRAIESDKYELSMFSKNCDKLNSGIYNKNSIIESLLKLTISK